MYKNGGGGISLIPPPSSQHPSYFRVFSSLLLLCIFLCIFMYATGILLHLQFGAMIFFPEPNALLL